MSQQGPSTVSKCTDIFIACQKAIERKMLIRRTSKSDKEFHFQNWFEDRLKETEYKYDKSGRNSYPDFTLVDIAEGYEVKGLGWPGRESSYDSNSQVPTGNHDGITIYYVFGRYPSKPKENEYEVIDLVICHGGFLNADRKYIHKNRSFKGFGSYGDITIRDRKMYVAPTPYGTLSGVDGQITLIIPDRYPVDPRLQRVGELTRTETDRLVVGYSFDLTTNELAPRYEANPLAGQTHTFVAYRVKGIDGPEVKIKNRENKES